MSSAREADRRTQGGTDQVDLSATKLVIGVSGSVAALGTPHLLMWLRARLGIEDVCVVLSEMAQRFVTKESLAAVADCPVVTGWSDLPAGTKSHVGLVNAAHAVLVMPATANVVAKIANGISDTVLTSVVAAAGCPVIVVPSMSETTWGKPANTRNVARLVADGYEVVEPRNGYSTSGAELEFGSAGNFREPLVRAIIRAHRGKVNGERV